MPANQSPRFTRVSRVGSVLCTAANTSSAGGGTIGTDMFLIITADATNGSLIRRVHVIPVATTPTTMTSSNLRIFMSTQSSGATTSANTILVAEITGGTPAADNSTTAIFPCYELKDFELPAGYSLLFSNHVAPAANTNWRATAFIGDY